MITNIRVFPRIVIENAIENVKTYPKKFILISISTTEQEKVENLEILKSKGSCVDYLQTVFHDLTEPYKEHIIFDEEKANEIINFINKHEDSKEELKLIVHCDAGISRSGAVGVWACRYLNIDEALFRELNKNIFPNSLVLETLAKVSGMSGEYGMWWNSLESNIEINWS